MGSLGGSRLERSSVVLSSLEAEDCRSLFESSSQKSFAKGATIFSVGEPGQLLLLIESGRVEVSVTSRSGRKSVIAHMGAGEVLGEIAALDGGPRTADVIAASTVSARVLSRDNLLKFVAHRPNVAAALIAELCGKVRNATDMYSAQSTTEGQARLAVSMLRLFDKWGEETGAGGVALSVKLSQTELGEFCGLARENVNRHIRGWSEAGLISHEGGKLVLLDRDGLEDIVEA